MLTELVSGDLPKFDAERAHRILDSTLPKQAVEDVLQLAVQLFQMPIASLTLIDAERVWRKASIGINEQAIPASRDAAFAARLLDHPDQILVIEDARASAAFASHPYVTAGPGVRFYAGAAIIVGEVVVGALAVMDTSVRQFDQNHRDALRRLARQLAAVLEVQQDTERQAQGVYRENQYLQALLRTGQGLYFVVDRNYCFRYLSPGYLGYAQRTREQLEGMPISRLIGEERFLAACKPDVDQAMLGMPQTKDVTIPFSGVGERHVRVTTLPARDQPGNVIGAVVQIEDITDLKEVELSLRRTVHLLEEKKADLQRFIYILSHDLREPVNTIMNFSALLREQYANDANTQTRRYLEFMTKGGERMRNLLEDLLKYVRVDSNEPERSAVALEELLQEVKQDLGAALQRTAATLTHDVLPIVQGDRHMLRVLLQNLVENAIKFVAAGTLPQVHVSATVNDDAWLIHVIDNGIGIREEQRSVIFELFKRLHGRKQYEGTGLGLATCRRIAELHGGAITVNPAAAGGSCFDVMLPRR